MNCNCSVRKKERSKEEYKSLINRLNRIEGQVRGIRNMLENDAYCVDILTQAAATKAAINAFSAELFSEHMESCVKNDLVNGNKDTLDEAIITMRKLMK